jgi:hypothetical protein
MSNLLLPLTTCFVFGCAVVFALAIVHAFN